MGLWGGRSSSMEPLLSWQLLSIEGANLTNTHVDCIEKRDLKVERERWLAKSLRLAFKVPYHVGLQTYSKKILQEKRF